MDRPPSESAASALLISYAYDQVQVLRKQDGRVRRDEPDALHKLRIATRRLRAALATYRKLLDPDVGAHLRRELKWLAATSGPARDAQVLHERLTRLLAAQPVELVIGPVSQRIDDDLTAGFAAARHELVSALDSERYARLIDALDALLANPPLTPRASKPGRKTLPRLVNKAGRRLRRSIESATATEGAERDAALHQVRTCAKRLRYAAEVATSIHPKRAAGLSSTAHDLQRILGDHHDSVVAREHLLRLAEEARERGESDFTYGQLHALESGRAAASERQFLQAWEHLPTGSLEL